MNSLPNKSIILCFSLILIIVMGPLHSTHAYSQVGATSNTSNDKIILPVKGIVKRQVNLWKVVFGKVHSESVIIHDSDYPDIIVDLLNFTKMARKAKLKHVPNRVKRDRTTQKYIERYEQGIERFKTHGAKALRYGPIEERLYSTYSKNKFQLKRLMAGRINLRSQSGLSNDLKTGVKRSKKYLPYMKEIFHKMGVPPDLTHIAFVESMFHTGAHSKAGAAGIWQIIKATGKQFLNINSIVDERYNPLKATYAAAKILKENKRILGSWPLAITAYNHGSTGMLNAKRQLQTDDMDKIIRHYRSPSFRFASKNFYAEFIAINRLYRSIDSEQKSASESLQRINALKFKKPMTVGQIMKLTGLSESVLKKYNQDIRSKAFGSLKYKKLPANYQIFLPMQKALVAKENIAYNADNKKLRKTF